ncbi:MAG: sigma-54 dependent transcriptional regulator [Candidatus Poribacteria bacterium]|nr:sigma-54 dependent transcriptional regulator [Candidatus Poribacteria bacterium]
MTPQLKPNILIIDDEAGIRESLQGVLEDEGYSVATAPSGEEGIRTLASQWIDLVFLDILMPGGIDGLETLQRIKQLSPDTEVVMITGHGTFELALDAGRLGAQDFLGKPLSLDTVLDKVEDAIQKIAMRYPGGSGHSIIGDSPPMQEILAKIRQVAPTNGRVLITGESGTGKELVAHAIHQFSSRRKAPFVKMNCAAIPQDLVEAELFGHERGAFTGASGRRIGTFEQADGGTILLDEISDMSPSTQAKVLRVLEEQEFERVGGGQTIRVDVRVISATNKNLQEEIQAGNFRADLYYRLNVVPVHIPPLRERIADLPILMDYFLDRFCRENRKPKMQASENALKALSRYDWPGNVRELRNLIERLVILSPQQVIEVEDLPAELDHSQESLHVTTEAQLREARNEFERHFIQKCLQANNWNITETARQLGIERTNLHRKMRQYNISRET